MPKSRIYTNSGFLEVQWQKDGDLICIFSAVKDANGDEITIHETMHQFTSTNRADIKDFNRVLRRAIQQTRDLTAGPSGSLMWKINWEDFLKLTNPEKNVFLGIPMYEEVTEESYKAMFTELAI